MEPHVVSGCYSSFTSWMFSWSKFGRTFMDPGSRRFWTSSGRSTVDTNLENSKEIFLGKPVSILVWKSYLCVVHTCGFLPSIFHFKIPLTCWLGPSISCPNVSGHGGTAMESNILLATLIAHQVQRSIICWSMFLPLNSSFWTSAPQACKRWGKCLSICDVAGCLRGSLAAMLSYLRTHCSWLLPPGHKPQEQMVWWCPVAPPSTGFCHSSALHLAHQCSYPPFLEGQVI